MTRKLVLSPCAYYDSPKSGQRARLAAALRRGEVATIVRILRRSPTARGTNYGTEISLGMGGWSLANLTVTADDPHPGKWNGRGWARYLADLLVSGKVEVGR